MSDFFSFVKSIVSIGCSVLTSMEIIIGHLKNGWCVVTLFSFLGHNFQKNPNQGTSLECPTSSQTRFGRMMIRHNPRSSETSSTNNSFRIWSVTDGWILETKQEVLVMVLFLRIFFPEVNVMQILWRFRMPTQTS